MTITQAHPYAYYTGQIPGWRNTAASLYEELFDAMRSQTYRLKPLVQQNIGKFNVRLRQSARDNLPNLKKNAIVDGFNRINTYYNAHPLIIYPAHIPNPLTVDVFSIPETNFSTVGQHVYKDRTDRATITINGNNPKVQRLNLLTTGTAITYKGKAFRPGVNSGGPAGIPDYVSDRAVGNQKHARVEATIIHEMGHVLHQLNNPAAFWPINCCSGDYNMTVGSRLDISNYANTSYCEFVAELFTAKIYGFTGPNLGANALYGDYLTLGGVPV
jgi:hypothetical protein